MPQNQLSKQITIQTAYAQLITAMQTVGDHPDCNPQIVGLLTSFELELHNHLLDLAEQNTQRTEIAKRAEVLSVLLQQAFA